MTEFMQECVYFRECEQGRLVGCRFCEVHRNRNMRAAVRSVIFYPLLLIASHPCSGTLAFPWVEVGVEHSQEASVGIKHFESLYVRMIHWYILVLTECYSV